MYLISTVKVVFYSLTIYTMGICLPKDYILLVKRYSDVNGIYRFT